MWNKTIAVLKILAIVYITICMLLFLFQEKLIFFPQKLSKSYIFKFPGNFEETYIKTSDNKKLHGVLFKTDSPKGLIYYLHGNAGSLASWGNVAGLFTDLNYDVFILDYRGYGKSEGKIKSQKQLYSDIQQVYDKLKKNYQEEKIIVLGYSIGTGLASRIAADNNPQMLILQAPYYSLKDMMKHTLHVIPGFILKYKLNNKKNLKRCSLPVYIFHGNRDKVIYYGSSLKLTHGLGKNVSLITLNDQGHNGMTDNPDYRKEIQDILDSP